MEETFGIIQKFLTYESSTKRVSRILHISIIYVRLVSFSLTYELKVFTWNYILGSF